METFFSSSEMDTENFGMTLGQLLWEGSIAALTGDLGVGKTALTRGIARGLDIHEYITSPTYTLVHEYQGRLPLYHFDVYRIEDPDEMLDIGYEEYFFGQGVTVIEWPQRVRELLPENRLEIDIRKGQGESERTITLTAFGKQYEELVKEISIE